MSIELRLSGLSGLSLISFCLYGNLSACEAVETAPGPSAGGATGGATSSAGDGGAAARAGGGSGGGEVVLMGGSAGAGGTSGGREAGTAGADGEAPTGGDAGGGSSGTSSCPSVFDPNDGCPIEIPVAGGGCPSGAICDYVVCGDCNTVATCAGSSGGWSLQSVACGGSCSPPERTGGPWAKSRRLLLALQSGNCGELSGLNYDPSTNQLDSLTCTTVSDQALECGYKRVIRCTLEELELTFDMSVSFHEHRGWRGLCLVSGAGAHRCSGVYGLAF